MKKALILIALASTVALAADQYNPMTSGNGRGGNYQNQSSNNYRNNSQTLYGDNQQMNSDSAKASSNEAISKKVKDLLAGGWFSKGYSNVSFDVNNGVVNLRGSVDTRETKEKLGMAVRELNGVKRVNNQVMVKENQDAE